MSQATVDVTERDDRVVVELNRPDRRNAITRDMVAELHDVLDDLERVPRFLVVTGGHNGVFAAGADIEELLARGRDEAMEGINLRLFERLRRTPLPSVAAVDGHALGAGAELAYACDLRVASDRAVFGNPEVRLGILAGAGASYRLRELLGEARAKEMLLAGRQLDAEQARAVGLVMDVVPAEQLFEAADALVDRMAKASPWALRITKLAIDAPDQAHPLVDLLGQAVLFEDNEKRARMERFLKRRRTGRKGRSGR